MTETHCPTCGNKLSVERNLLSCKNCGLIANTAGFILRWRGGYSKEEGLKCPSCGYAATKSFFEVKNGGG